MITYFLLGFALCALVDAAFVLLWRRDVRDALNLLIERFP